MESASSQLICIGHHDAPLLYSNLWVPDCSPAPSPAGLWGPQGQEACVLYPQHRGSPYILGVWIDGWADGCIRLEEQELYPGLALGPMAWQVSWFAFRNEVTSHLDGPYTCHLYGSYRQEQTKWIFENFYVLTCLIFSEVVISTGVTFQSLLLVPSSISPACALNNRRECGRGHPLKATFTFTAENTKGPNPTNPLPKASSNIMRGRDKCVDFLPDSWPHFHQTPTDRFQAPRSLVRILQLPLLFFYVPTDFLMIRAAQSNFSDLAFLWCKKSKT